MFSRILNLPLFFTKFYFESSKGQLISEKIDAVLNFPKIHRIIRISALASNMGQIKKVNAHYHPN